MPRANIKTKPPETLLEVYGNSPDSEATPALFKDQIDQKAKEFWNQGAKLFNLGKSVHMLQIFNNASESILVPQGTSYSGEK
jgi:hypothetical protein